MSNIDITVIIPVRNMEKYIKKCIDSILIQKEKLEIIIIDFGSSDNTVNIINSYNDKRINLKLMNLKDVAEARNAGVTLAKGKFLSFIDADDWLEDKYYNKVIRKMEEKEMDIGITGYIHIDEKDNIIVQKQYDDYINKNIECDSKFFKDVGVGNINCECWNKVYRTSFIRQSKVIFDDTYGVNGEDLLYNYEMYLFNPKIVFIENAFYFHLLRKKSLGKTNDCCVGERFNYIIRKIIEKAEKKNKNIYMEILELYISLMLQCIISKKDYKLKKIEYNSLINNEILHKVTLIEIVKSIDLNCKRKAISIMLKTKMQNLFILLTYLQEKKV